MKKALYQFSHSTVECYFDCDFSIIHERYANSRVIFVTDEHIASLHSHRFKESSLICIPAGENFKIQQTVNFILEELLRLQADRETLLVGVGGGVVTDITGFAASIYKRGIHLGFVPTSILAMVDAAIGGKNGIDIGLYKNMAGTVYQPAFILYDYSFLNTLPVKEWVNGFAEIIKHACIRDPLMFGMLERYSLHEYQSDASLLADLIERNVQIKMSVVTADEFEKGERKLLNFGHTFGHAIENLHHLPHGHAISIGMVAACNLSVKMNNFHFEEARRVVRLLAHYHLPVDIETDHAKVFELVELDKKRTSACLNFIVLNRIGEAVVQQVQMDYLKEHVKEFL